MTESQGYDTSFTLQDPSQKTLITGYRGFVGKHLLNRRKTVAFADEKGRIDLSENERMDRFFLSQSIDRIIHLAALSNVPESFDNPNATIETNLCGTVNLLNSLKRTRFVGRFLYVSSGDVYGKVEAKDLPITELQPPNPTNPYAVSKLAAEHYCLQFAPSSGFDIIIARPFNHIGPGQTTRFVVPRLIEQVYKASISCINRPIIAGSLDVTRDFSDVRDIQKAYFALLNKGKNGEIYNVCSSAETQIGELLSIAKNICKVNNRVALDKNSIRPNEQKRAQGSNMKLRIHTGWAPTINPSTTLNDM
ncbi:GDP-mannose 4,6-dehydratase, partial [Granulosicoccus sp.]|nr:GDP-mannose 4,6-dehydratase [Granulosicoccus sp.]